MASSFGEERNEIPDVSRKNSKNVDECKRFG
jgi:hypothetical protein